MYSIHTSQPLPGLGAAVVIIAAEQRTTGVLFAEFHILLPSSKARRCITQRFNLDFPETELGMSVSEYTLTVARDTLQNLIFDRSIEEKTPFPPATVVLSQSDASALRLLQFRGLCQEELGWIGNNSRCQELRSLMGQIRYLPTITCTDISPTGKE